MCGMLIMMSHTATGEWQSIKLWIGSLRIASLEQGVLHCCSCGQTISTVGLGSCIGSHNIDLYITNSCMGSHKNNCSTIDLYWRSPFVMLDRSGKLLRSFILYFYFILCISRLPSLQFHNLNLGA